MPYSIVVNGVPHVLDVEPTMPLLWALREHVKVTGPKFGCGVNKCGACVVLINGSPERSCTKRISTCNNAEITTIEGLGPNELQPIQQAWIEEGVPQCGYCQSGQILLASSLLAQNPTPSRDEIDAHMAENLCRCGTYGSMRRAIKRAGELMSDATGGTDP